MEKPFLGPREACPERTNKSIVGSRILLEICESGLSPKLEKDRLFDQHFVTFIALKGVCSDRESVDFHIDFRTVSRAGFEVGCGRGDHLHPLWIVMVPILPDLT